MTKEFNGFGTPPEENPKSKERRRIQKENEQKEKPDSSPKTDNFHHTEQAKLDRQFYPPAKNTIRTIRRDTGNKPRNN